MILLLANSLLLLYFSTSPLSCSFKSLSPRDLALANLACRSRLPESPSPSLRWLYIYLPLLLLALSFSAFLQRAGQENKGTKSSVSRSHKNNSDVKAARKSVPAPRGPDRKKPGIMVEVAKMSTSHCPFLSLPAEIRNIIYEYTLVEKDEVISIDYTRHGKATRRFMNPGDFRATHGEDEIHNEASSILYMHNHFAFLDATAMKAFLKQIGRNIGTLRQASLLYWGRHQNRQPNKSAFHALTRATNLHAFVLEAGCLQSVQRWNITKTAEDFYQSAHGWLWTVVGRTGSKAAAFDRLILSPRDRQPGEYGMKHKLQVFRILPGHYHRDTIADLPAKEFRAALLKLMA